MGAAAYFALFELLKARPDIGPNISRILLLTAAASLCLLYLILRLAGIRDGPSRDAREWSCARRETFALLLGAAAYFALFELLTARPDLGPNISRILLLAAAATLCLLYLILVPPNRRDYQEGLWSLAASNLESMPISSVIILEALIALVVTPFLLFSIEALANSAAILAYLLLVVGVALRFAEMKGLLNIDKQKEILIKILSLAVLPAAGIMGAFELMKVNPGAGQIFLAIMVMAAVILPVFAYLYLRNRNLDGGKISS